MQRAKAAAIEKASPEQVWIRSLDRRMPFGKVLVAIANKRAQQICIWNDAGNRCNRRICTNTTDCFRMWLQFGAN